MSCYILSRHVEFLKCGSICGFSNYPPGRMSWHILSRHEAFLMRQNMASLQCGSIDVFFKVPYCMNVLSHFEQTCGFLTVRISSCVFKYAFCVNVFSHFEQTCGFSPVWITSCFFKKQQKNIVVGKITQPFAQKVSTTEGVHYYGGITT